MKMHFRLSTICALILFLSFGCSTPGPDVSSESPQARAPGTFTFAFLSDTHIVTTDTGAKNGDRTSRLRTALDLVHGRKDIDFIMLGGDLIEDAGSVKQFEAFDATMKTPLPVFPIAGNHDNGKPPSSANLALWNSRGYGRGNSHLEQYGFVHKNTAFYVIDTFACESTDPAVAAIADSQLREMDAFFAANAKCRQKIVCGHAPLFIRSSDEADEYFNIPIGYRSRILDVMKRNGVSVYLSGHRHGDYTTHDPKSGITVLTQGSLAFALGEGQRTGFSMIAVGPDGVTKEFIPVIDSPVASSAGSSAAGASFIVLGDLHYDRLDDHDLTWLAQKPDDLRQVTKEYTVYTQNGFPALMKRALEQARAAEPPARAMIQLGDLQEGLAGTPELARQMARHSLDAITAPGFPVPWILVKGNHDITGPGAPEAYREIVIPFLREELKTPIEKSYYTWTTGSVQIFCADSYDPQGLLPFLEAELARSTAKVKIVALHQPIVPVTGRCWHVLNRPEDAPARERLLELLGRHRAVVLCGHLHRAAVLRRDTPAGPFVQVMVNSVVREPDRVAPYQTAAGYGPSLIELEPRFSPDTRERREAILAAEAPFVRDFHMEDLPGYAVLSVFENPEKISVRFYAGATSTLSREIDLTAMVRDGGEK